MKPKYQLHIVSDCGNRETYTSGESVKECIDKLKNYHTFGEVDFHYYAEKGKARLNEELESGWYLNL